MSPTIEGLSKWQQKQELKRQLRVVSETSEGDSNDDEIQALQEALSQAPSMLGITEE